ncbi:phage tail tape measure protein [Brevibacillus borstelensis]|uniref:phage tail tape measure protein n=1 Tax=Brevibacillus borstelensis TaxID=45462 RepID=UPI002E1A569C|nr:phage tail tape measure protein [Brevibacillus borstelensis]MED1851829.1 phage tail tape measure protein [Brevibacillus borstelensis]
MADKEIYRLDLVVDVTGDGEVKSKLRAMDRYIEQTEKRARMLDRVRASPAAQLIDRVTEPARRITSVLGSLVSKGWSLTIRARDEASRVIEQVRRTATSLPVILGITLATAGIGTSIGDTVSKSMNFEAQLSTIKALTGASRDEMIQVQSLAVEMGAKTKYSALEAAQGIEELLKAGLSVSQVKSGGLEAALNLATAGGLELADAAEIMSTALNAYKADSMSAAQAANILAGTANASATSVQELRYSLAAVSAVASGVGLSFRDTNAALGAFANNGLKGSDAGTSLKTMLMNLSPSTKGASEMMKQLGIITSDGTNRFFDAKGKIKSMAEIADVLRSALIKLNPKERGDALKEMFGSDAIRAGNILFKEGAEGINKMIKETEKVTALDVAKEKMNNAAGAVEQFRGAMETMQISALMPMMPLIKDFALLMADLAEKYTPAVTAAFERFSAQAKDFLGPFLKDANMDAEMRFQYRHMEDPSDPGVRLEQKLQNMDWSDKVVYVLDGATDAMSNWMAGPGGEKVEKIFGKLAEIGFRAWIGTLQNLMEGSLDAMKLPETWNNLKEGNVSGAWESLQSGNTSAGLGMAGLAALLGGGMLAKGAWTVGKGAWGAGKGAWDLGRNLLGKNKRVELEPPSRGGLQTSRMDVNTVAISAGRVYVNGPASNFGANWDRPAAGGSILGPDGNPLQRSDTQRRGGGGRTRRYHVANRPAPVELPSPSEKAGRERSGWFKSKAPTTGLEEMGNLSRLGKVGRAAGIVGTVASVGLGAYDLYQTAKQGGWKEAVSTRGGAVAGSAVGGVVGGAIGSLAGPLGTMAGAYVGSWVGETAGKWLDESGITKKVVDKVSDLKDAFVGWWKGDDTKKMQNDMKVMGDSAGRTSQETKTHLGSIQTVTSQGGFWGTAMMSRLIDSIKANLPGLSAAAESVVSTVERKLTGVASKPFSILDLAQPSLLPTPAPAYGFPGVPSGGFRQYASGGFISRPHFGLVGEAGPEVIIPLSPNRRGRAMALFERTSRMLGVRPFADGGLVGGSEVGLGQHRDFSLAYLVEQSQNSSPETSSAVSPDSNHGDGLYVTVDAPVNLYLQGNDIDEEALALRIGWQIVNQMKRVIENRG